MGRTDTRRAIVWRRCSRDASPARADGRAEFVTCQAMVDRAAHAAQAGTAATRPDEAALERCRQIIRDWTLRESAHERRRKRPAAALGRGSALGCSTGRYPADNARSVEGGVSSIAS